MTKLDKIFGIIVLILILVTTGGAYVQKSRELPPISDSAIFYIGIEGDEDGRLMAFDPGDGSHTLLTPPHLLVNQFVLVKNKDEKSAFFLGIKRSKLAQIYDLEAVQELYRLEFSTGKLRRVNSPGDFGYRYLLAHPSGKFLLVDRSEKKSQPHLWKYQITKNKWSPFQEAIPFQNAKLSPDGSWVLAANPLDNLGYSLIPFYDSASDPIAIGNYEQGFGFSSDGKKMLFSQKPDQDIFADTSFLTVFSEDGTSQNYLEESGNIEQAVWGADNNEVFVAQLVFENEEPVQRLLRLDLSTGEDEVLKTWKETQLTHLSFQDGRLIIITEKQDYEDLPYDESRGVQGLLDMYAQMEKQVLIQEYDREAGTFKILDFKGVMPWIGS